MPGDGSDPEAARRQIDILRSGAWGVIVAPGSSKWNLFGWPIPGGLLNSMVRYPLRMDTPVRGAEKNE